MKWLVSIVLLLLCTVAHADYLIVQRNGNLRETHSTASEVLEKVHTGDTLLLLEDAQTDAFYHVITTASHQQGWIYRTLVRKVEGDLEPGGETNVDAVVDIRVLDVGAGLCNLIKLPGDKYVVYDAGGDFNTDGNRTLAQIKEYIPAGSTIELMVLSHCDADHIVAAEQVIRDYSVKKVLW